MMKYNPPWNCTVFLNNKNYQMTDKYRWHRVKYRLDHWTLGSLDYFLDCFFDYFLD